MKNRCAWLRSTAVAICVLPALCTGCIVNAPNVTPESSAPTTPQVSATAKASVTEAPSEAIEPSPSASPKPWTGPGVYSFAYQGAVGTIQIPASIMDPRLERYGDYRRLAKAPAITYVIAQVDNQSDDTINMYEVVIVTDAGQQIEATSISNYVDAWSNAFAGEGGDIKKYTKGIELSNASNFYLHPGAKGTAILGAKEPIKTVKRVFVYPAGAFDRVEARRIK
ncbi:MULTISPECIES: hypothetical protein [unclassified Kribbella]|uniref:hypothetical protein n=1 Tax=unclassified Kribbella TaxID=2644121 RepID=UPI003017911F